MKPERTRRVHLAEAAMRRTLWLLPILFAGCAAPPPSPLPPVMCLIFLANDCPISNAYAPEIRRLHDEYSGRGVHLQPVYAVRNATDADLLRHAEEYQLPNPLLDSQLTVARKYGATVVPEAVVVVGDEVVYRGRIDDRFPKVGGKRREQPTTHDLRDALDAVLAGRPAAVPRTRAVGCDIDYE